MTHRSAHRSAPHSRVSTNGVAGSIMAATLAMLAFCGRSPAQEARHEPAPGAQWTQDERSYAVFDALFLQRNNAVRDRPVVVNSTAPNLPAISAGDLQSTIGTGARLLYGMYGEEDIGWEVGYLGVFGMSATRATTSSGGTLEAPNQTFATQTGLVDGFSARVSDNSSVNSIELNMLVHEYDGGFNRRSGRPAQRCDGYDGGHLDWIGGFRWANLQDAAVLAIPPGSSSQPSTYGVNATSNLFAAQVGTRGRMAFERWAVEGWMKIGLAGTVLSQSQSIVDATGPLRPYRQPTSADTAGMGMIADMNLSAIYRLDDVWGLRIGYNLMWLTGVALAPDQWDFSASQTGGGGINGTGSLFLSGANLGLEARW